MRKKENIERDEKERKSDLYRKNFFLQYGQKLRNTFGRLPIKLRGPVWANQRPVGFVSDQSKGGICVFVSECLFVCVCMCVFV